MLRVLLFIALAALPLYAFIDCAMKDETQIKNLPKWGWLLVILFTQAFGAILTSQSVKAYRASMVRSWLGSTSWMPTREDFPPLVTSGSWPTPLRPPVLQRITSSPCEIAPVSLWAPKI